MTWSLQLPTLGDELMSSSRNKISTFRGSKRKECPYHESNAPKILDKLLEKGIKELLGKRIQKK